MPVLIARHGAELSRTWTAKRETTAQHARFAALQRSSPGTPNPCTPFLGELSKFQDAQGAHLRVQSEELMNDGGSLEN